MIFETYRPLKSLEDILQWMLTDDVRGPEADRFFPNLNKAELLDLGYISLRSSHTRGGAVDLTLIDEDTGLELDMGTEFDYFGDKSHTTSRRISKVARNNRKTLVELMEASGFANYEKEWTKLSQQSRNFFHFLLNHTNPDGSFEADLCKNVKQIQGRVVWTLEAIQQRYALYANTPAETRTEPQHTTWCLLCFVNYPGKQLRAIFPKSTCMKNSTRLSDILQRDEVGKRKFGQGLQ
ncbi:hypothetical protein CYMTET_14189 [Cymbomonas tetramitiformis]|uniref:Uncharacterized protein n=1 Tax=Cymbomonas tetramitiformis TaxID=36881 RepID=A0AAE0GGT8_9CHLO|nr:hypothetical protein CYMTET_14189 [Cymbomonas tetramitiformis]